jgi:hypothetical protein
MKHNICTRSNIIIAALALCLLPPAVLARSTALVEPEPVTINCSLSTEKMQEGIKDGGSMRGWKVITQSPGNAELQYIKDAGKHTISVNVSYTSNTFSITYKDSDNLNYTVKDDGTRYLHPRPIGWMKNLSMDIQHATNSLCP